MSIPALTNSSKGIACMIGCAILLTMQDAITKWLTGDYSNGEIMFWRGLMSMLPLALLIQRAGGIAVLRSTRPGALMLRALLAALTSLLVVVSVRHLPLADALAVIFTSPIILTAMAVPFLGERVGGRRWIAVGIGFAGMLVIVRPTGQAFELALLAPITAAFLSASRDVVTRRLGATDRAVTILFYSTVLSILIGFVDMPRGLALPTARDMGMFLLGGSLWATAQLLQIMAFTFAEASLISPFRYLSLIWAAVLGYLVWGDVPDQWVITGSVLVVGSGLYILHRERLKNLRNKQGAEKSRI